MRGAQAASSLLVRGAELQIWNRGSIRRLRLPSRAGHCPAGATSIAWIDRNRVVYAYGSGGQQTSGLWVADPTGSGVRRFEARGTRWAATPRWSPNGDRVVYEDGPILTHAGGCGQYDTELRVVRADAVPRHDLDGQHARAGGEPALVARRPLHRLRAALPLRRRRLRDLRRGHGGERREEAAEYRLQHVALLRVGRAQHRLRGAGLSAAPRRPRDRRDDRDRAGPRSEAAPSEPLLAFLRGNELWTSTLDGAEPRRITAFRPAASDTRLQPPARWSPNSRRLALADQRGVLVVDRVTGAVRVIEAPGVIGVEWSPDGRRLSFASARCGRYSRPSPYSARTELYVVSADGGEPQRLTRDLANVSSASWRP